MSYILDALRRADAERERGNVPGLHTQPAPVPHADDGRTGRAPAWVWPAAGLAVAVIVALAWQALARDTAPPERVAGVAGVAVVPVAPQVVPPPPLPAALPAPITAPAAAQAASAAPTPRAATATPPRKPAAVVAAAPAKPPRAVSATVAATASATTTATAEPRLYKPAELPDELRKEVLALVVGGAMYSQTPANRMLIINGQLFHEGDTLAPGLTLEQIKLKSAVLKLKGYRVGIDY